MLVAQTGGNDFFATFICMTVVMGFMGEGICRLSDRMKSVRVRVRGWAIGLGIVTGIAMMTGTFSSKNSNGAEVLGLPIAGAVFAVLAFGIWYFFVALVVLAYQHVLAPPFRAMGRISERGAARRRQRELDQQRQRDTEASRRLSEERERQSKVELERRKTERAKATEEQGTAQRRRDDARARCDVFYEIHAPELLKRFPRETYDDFKKRYFGEDKPADQVEKRADELLVVLRQHLEKIDPPKKTTDVASLTKWYEDTRRKIEALQIDERSIKAQVAQLNARYTELMQEHLENLQP
jgi:hypothetical protein